MKALFKNKTETNIAANVESDKQHALSGMQLFKAKVRSFLRSETVRKQIAATQVHDVVQENDEASRIFTGELHEPDKLTEATILRKRLSQQEMDALISPDVHNIIKNAMEGYVRGLKS